MDSVAALFAETDGLIGEMHHRVAFGRWGTLSVGNSVGTIKGGGDFENLFVRLFMTDGHLLTRIEIFELDDLEVAKRRYQALNDELEQGRARSTDAAQRGDARLGPHVPCVLRRSDWSALEAQTGPRLHLSRSSQRRAHRVRHPAVDRIDATDGRRRTREPSASSSPCWANDSTLEWVRWTGRSDEPGADGAEFEVEILRVVEVDDRWASRVGLGLRRRRSSSGERGAVAALRSRAMRAGESRPSIYRNLEAFNHHDLEAMRATLRDDFVFDDRRRTGSGALGADAYVESVAALLGETERPDRRNALSDRDQPVGHAQCRAHRRYDEPRRRLREPLRPADHDGR